MFHIQNNLGLLAIENARTLEKDDDVAVSILQPTIVGTRALIMGNTISMNRHHELTKQWNALVHKRKKSDEEQDEIELLQWLMSSYYSDKLGPVLPTANILASAIHGARKFKEGPLIESFVTCVEGEVPLEYDGPRDQQGIWDAGRYTSVAPTKRGVLAVRPIFEDWRCTFSVQLDLSGIDERTFLRHLVKAGTTSGIGTWRKRYGRYRVELKGKEVLPDGSLGGKFKED